jgi:hypothetical protein
LRGLARLDATFGQVEHDTVPYIDANADIAVAPFRAELWEMSFNRSGDCCPPLVSTSNVGGAHDPIEHRETGFHVPPDYPAAAPRDPLQCLIDGEFHCPPGARSPEIARRLTPEARARAGYLVSAPACR